MIVFIFLILSLTNVVVYLDLEKALIHDCFGLGDNNSSPPPLEMNIYTEIEKPTAGVLWLHGLGETLIIVRV